MADQPANELLNRLAGRAYRSLLQYAVECWPWTDASTAAEQQAIEQLAARQQSFVGRLVDLLAERGQTIDLGNFPDNSELHYVSVDYLVQKLIADEQNLVADLESAQGTLHGDPPAARLVSDLLAAEQANIARLKELNAKPVLIT
ncbi:MAG: hypothetical protein HY290_07980 [Planctomycetia bacterium]|nr:hypothetical protein [Planctomycetia bacterium]